MKTAALVEHINLIVLKFCRETEIMELVKRVSVNIGGEDMRQLDLCPKFSVEAAEKR